MSFTDIISIAAQLILSLSILVVLHECGHFFPAKWFKTKVEKFYLFFDPYFSLWKYKKGDTEYGIGWIPFGGYVKIAGMVDESMDMEQLKHPPQPWEFRSKKSWQRLIIMVGGVVVNFVLGFFLFAMILNVWGRSYIKNADMKYGISVDSIGQKMGLRDGDVILGVGDLKLERFSRSDVVKQIALNNANTIKVLRNGKEEVIQIPGEVSASLSKRGVSIIGIRFPQVIDSVLKDSEAFKMGVKKKDKVLAINNNADVAYAHQFLNEISNNKDKPIALKIQRGNDTISLNGKLDTKGKLGVFLGDAKDYLHFSKEKFSIGQAIPEGIKEGVGFLTSQIQAFGQMFKGKLSAKDNLGSILSVATLFDPAWDWEGFWKITAMLSVILAFFNILPIPALDGGYVLFLLIEMITGKKFSDSTMEKVTTVGFLLLITLMIVALGFDINRWF